VKERHISCEQETRQQLPNKEVLCQDNQEVKPVQLIVGECGELLSSCFLLLSSWR
jgi:hypothetical protein